MPLYDFRCEAGHRFERMVKLADFELLQLCSCRVPASRVISAPMFNVDSTSYTCPVTGDYISSKHQHENNLRKQGCRVQEPGEKEEFFRRRDWAEKQVDAKVDESLERTWETLPSDTREKLANEVVASDITLARESPNAH